MGKSRHTPEVTHHVGTIPTTAYTNLKGRLLRSGERRLADIRIFRVDNSGRHRPTGRGIRLPVETLPELLALVDRMIAGCPPGVVHADARVADGSTTEEGEQ